MTFCRLVWWLILACGIVNSASASADEGMVPRLAGVIAVRAWMPPPGADDLASAQAALQQVARPAQPGDRPEFRAPAHQPVWFALDLPANPQSLPRVLELTHPSIRAADLYLPRAGGDPLVLRSGRDLPMHTRANARFPATLDLPSTTGAGTVYLRLKGAVPLRGQFLLQTADDWKRQSGWQFGAMAFCFSIAAMAVMFAAWRAVRLRSVPYGLYALLGFSIGMTGMFISGFGETWAWPLLADWRGPVSSAMACVSAGLALLLAERAFAIEVRAPAFSLMLRLMGVLCPLAGVLGLAFDVSIHQLLSHGAATAAIGMSLFSFWFAWRTANRVAVWLLLGFVPVSLGVGLTTLAVAGVIPFSPWVLMAMPLGSALEVPFNLHGLHLLEGRRALVLRRQAEVARATGPAGEPAPAMLRRLSRGAGDRAEPASPSTLMLLRFQGLAPGSARLRTLDAVSVEFFLHAMMSTAVRPGNHVGRRALHEVVVRFTHQEADAAITSLLTALFAQALRSERYGIEPRDTDLRIAYGRIDGADLTLAAALGRLGRALDDPVHASQRRIELDLRTEGLILR